MSHFKSIDIQSGDSVEFLDITSTVQEFVTARGVENGIILVYTPHTTAGVTINENADPSVREDIGAFMKKKIPRESYFKHMEGNSPSHIMSSIISPSETLIVEGGSLILGTWQGIFFCEFDGPRRRKVYLKAIEG